MKSVMLFVVPLLLFGAVLVAADPQILNIFTSAFVSLDPPFVCEASRRALQSSVPIVFNVNSQESAITSDSVFAAAAESNISELIAQIEEDLLAGDSPHLQSRTSTEHDMVPSEDDVRQLIRAVSQTLFPDAPELSEEILETERPSARNGRSALGWLGSGKIVVCIGKELYSSRNNPKNIAEILCKCMQNTPKVESQCRIVSPVSSTLACSSGVTCPISLPAPYVPPFNPTSVDLPLISILPTPQVISKTTIDSEIYTYYLLWKSVSLLYHGSMLSTCNSATVPKLTIPGWTTSLTVNLVSEKRASQNEVAPFAILARRTNSVNPLLTDFLISIRATQTSTEWGINFAYNQVLQKLDFFGGTPLHRGFLSIASMIWSAFKLQFQEVFQSGQLGLITVTGHSLGGSVAAVLSYLLAEYYPTTLSGTDIPRHRAVLFGAARSGGSRLSSELSKKVVIRSIASEFDPVPLIPCSKFPGCPADLVPVPTARDLKTQFTFAEYPGSITILTNQLTPFFATQRITNLKFGIWHLCAYDCWTSLHGDSAHLSSCLGSSGDSSNQNAQCYE